MNDYVNKAFTIIGIGYVAYLYILFMISWTNYTVARFSGIKGFIVFMFPFAILSLLYLSLSRSNL